MKTLQIALLSTPLLTVAVPLNHANDWGITSPVTSSQGLLNEALRKDDPYMNAWNFGAFYSSRYEMKENGGFVGPGSIADFRTGVDNDNSYLMQKLLIRVGYTAKWFEVFVQGRHSSVTGDDRSSSGNGNLAAGPVGRGSSPESDGPMDLNQAYIMLGNHKEFPVSIKMGRQELILGEQRIVGPLGWNNVQRQWDAAKLRWQNPWFNAEAWTSRLVMPDDNGFNQSNPDEKFSGLQLTTKKIPKLWSEFYFLAKNADVDANAGDKALIPPPFRPPAAQDIYTTGFYLKNSTNDWKNLDFGVQAYAQFGNFKDFRKPVNSPREEHRAFAGIGALGYSWKQSDYTPRLGIEYSFASGDNDPSDGEHNTFVHLYPTGHPFYGWADFTSLQNVHNVRLQSSMMVTPRIKLSLEGHLRWLATANDNFYNVAGLPRGGIAVQAPAVRGTGYGINPDAGTFVGSEVDLMVNYRVHKHLTVEAAICHFFRGDYIKDSLSKAGSQDADYAYVQAQFNF